MSHHSSKKPRLNSDSDRLPDDTVFDLLNRLPVKSIVRFRCVSKSWNSVVTDPIFIATNFKLNLSLSNSLSANNNGYLLYVTHADPNDILSALELVTVVCNNDHTVAEVSRFNMPFTEGRMFGFFICGRCEGVSPQNLRVWRGNDGKYVMFDKTRKNVIAPRILIFVSIWEANNGIPPTQMIYYQGVVCTNTVAEVILSKEEFGFCISMTLFPRGGTRVREILLLGYCLLDLHIIHNVTKFVRILDEGICLIWEMKEYGDVKSWTKKIVFEMENVNRFFGCTRNGDLLIETDESDLFSFDPENEEGKEYLCEKSDGLYKVKISKLNRIVANPGDIVQIDARLNMTSIRALAAKKTTILTNWSIYVLMSNSSTSTSFSHNNGMESEVIIGNLNVADAYFGLQVVGQAEGLATQVVTRVEGSYGETMQLDEAEVYTLNTESWRRVVLPVECH
uniref:F-box domain-containing protein n=1 Tax=Fagus sylvatica TaxID=28930 RepID=A0A2N9J0M4_FAGSY